MGDTAMNVPVDLRTQEVSQLQTMVPDAATKLRETDVESLADEASTLIRVHDEHLRGLQGAGTVSMPADDWRAVVRHLDRGGDGLNAWWLRKKLVDRLSERLEGVGE
jgi:hypothetical protein